MKVFLLSFFTLLCAGRILQSDNKPKGTKIAFDKAKGTTYINPSHEIVYVKTKPYQDDIQTSKANFINAKKIEGENVVFPFFAMDEPGGTQKFGQLVENMFKTSPNELYGMDEVIKDLNDAVQEKEDVIMLSPQILQFIIYHLQDFKAKQDEIEGKKK